MTSLSIEKAVVTSAQHILKHSYFHLILQNVKSNILISEL